jgi:nucleoside-diphosphate-sugar epimerase
VTRVLVTGATGLLGRALVPALQRGGHDVVTTGRSWQETGQHIPADLTDRGHVRRLLRQARPRVVLHLAGGPAGDAMAMVRNNVHATSTLLDEMRALDQHVDRLVVAGSAAEYGAGDGAPVGEDAPVAPVTPYGRAKAAQYHVSQLLGDHVARHTVHVRPFNIVSPNLPTSSSLGNLRRQLLPLVGRGPRRVVCGRLDIERDFVAISTVVDAFDALVDLPDPPAVLNVCSGVSLRLADVFREAVAQSGHDVDLVQDPQLTSLPAARSVVGDPARLISMGLHEHVDAAALAAVLLAPSRSGA